MGARIDAHDDLWPRAEDRLDNDLAGEEPVASSRRGGVASALAIGAAFFWIVGGLWLARTSLAELDPIALVEFIAALCVPPALIGIAWLLTQRNSRAEQGRFASSAQAMRAEAAALERRVASLSDTLAAQREQLAAQLDAGAAAAGRLDAISHSMAEEIETADRHAVSLAEAAGRARTAVGDLLAALPLARTESEEVGRRFDQAGLAAAAQAAALDAQLTALGEHARDAETHANRAADTLVAHLTRMEQTGIALGSRLDCTATDVSATVEALVERTEHALERARTTLDAQGEAMHAAVAANQVTLEDAAQRSADALAARMQSIGAVIEQVAARLAAERENGATLVDHLSNGLSDVQRQLDTLHVQGVERSQLLAASISALGGSADAMTEALREGESLATRTIGTAESLLIALDAATREIDETLPEALARLDNRIGESKQVVAQAKPELLALVTAAESTHNAIEAIAGVIAEQRNTLDQLSTHLLDALTTGRAKADALGQTVEDTIGRTHRFAEDTAPQLLETLLRVRESAQVAADHARQSLIAVIPEAANELERATAEAMRRATGDMVERQVTSIVDATNVAVDAATRATQRIAAQIQAIADQASLIETRLDDARGELEAAGSDSLSRRVSLLIESLNSASIDITKVFAPEVSDSAWAAYLKGDRGVFTRRAVRLLDNVEVREIARLYDEDGRFREQVNRYIHDFEGMLRQILAQRDGSPLGVTLLSSDMGKLYVALAQAIERLR